MSIGWPIASRVLVAGVGIVASALVAELAVRVVALGNPGVRHLATARVGRRPEAYRTLESFLASRQPDIVPYRSWQNYSANSLGMYDREFDVPKPRGRSRLLALGDSFCYGMVPYPDNVLTLVEERLQRACHGRDLDLLNFCIPRAGLPEYGMVHELGAASYQPDLVVVHFYMGNDGPDLLHDGRGRAGTSLLRRHSYLWRYLSNTWRVFSDAPGVRPSAAPMAIGPAPRPRGGQRVSDRPDPTDQDPSLTGPTFSEAAFVEIAAGELGRLYRPAGGAESTDASWRPILGKLESLRRRVAGSGQTLVVVLYPSALQVYPELLATTVETLRAKPRYAGLDPRRVDTGLPSRVLLEYCRTAGLACADLTPALVRAAQASGNPLYIGRDTHWNISGNHAAAAAEAAFLQGLLCRASPSHSALARARPCRHAS